MVEAKGRLKINKRLLKIVKRYEKEYKLLGYGNTALEFELSKCNIETHFLVDHIFFTDWHSNKVFYSFEI